MAIIGKNVIENLTTAMYEDLRIVYREYIQNAADSIDKAIKVGLLEATEAQINITINVADKSISVYDNGTGISSKDFALTMSSIADSKKDRYEDKGFRGIGRLGGISVCNRLRFSSTVKGEDVISVCEWDAKKVRDVLVDKNVNPTASELVDMVLFFSEEKAVIDEHFFKVELLDIEKSASELLNVSYVKRYLQTVAPVPYAQGFYFKSKIHDFAKENGFTIDEYQVFVNNDRLFKEYTTKLFKEQGNHKISYDEILDIAFEIFKDSNGNPLAWIWYGISSFETQIPKINEMRGIRLRKGNIEIGDEYTFASHGFYDEPRGGLYYIGEVHAVSPDLIPNARRDYFNLNDTCREFENIARPLFYERLKKIYHYANDYKKAQQKIQELANEVTKYNEKINEGTFVNSDDKQKAKERIDKLTKDAEKAERVIKNRNEKEKEDKVLTRVYKEIQQKYPAENKEVKPVEASSEKDTKNKNYITQALSGYSKKEQKLVSEIYQIIKAVLPHDTAELLITKIQEELKK